MTSELADSGEARPRWRFRFSLLALLIFVTLACLFLSWIVQPNRATATALFQVDSAKQGLFGAPVPYDDRAFDILRNTQITLLKSQRVLQAALRDPKIAAIGLLQAPDPVAWLQERLEVECPQDSEILAIRLRGTEPQAADLKLIVDAVAKAYGKEVLNAELQRYLVRRDTLARSLDSLYKELERESELYNDMARELGVATNESGDVQQELELQRLARIDKELMRLESEQLKLETEGNEGNDKSYEQRVKFIEKRIKQLYERQRELEKKIAGRRMTSVDLAARKTKLKQLQAIAGDLSTKLEMMDIEAEASEELVGVKQIQPAIVEIE